LIPMDWTGVGPSGIGLSPGVIAVLQSKECGFKRHDGSAAELTRNVVQNTVVIGFGPIDIIFYQTPISV